MVCCGQPYCLRSFTSDFLSDTVLSSYVDILPYFRTNYFRNLGPRTIMNVFSKLAAFIITIYLARVLGPAQYGYFSFVIALAGIFSIFAGLGVPGYLQKELPRSNKARASALFYTSLLIVSLVLLFVELSSILAGNFLVTIFDRPGARILVALAGAYTTALVLMFLLEYTLIALHRLDRALFPAILRDVLRILLVVSLVSVAPTYLSPLTAYFISFILYSAALLTILRHILGRPSGFVPFHDVIIHSLPFLFFGLASVLLAYTDIVMLSVFRPVSEVGIYRVSVQALTALLAIIPIVHVSLPTLSKSAAEGRLRKTFLRLVFFSLAVSAIIIPVLYVLAPVLIPLFFGDSYTPGIPVFRVFLFFLPAYFIYALGIQVLVSKNRDWEQIIYPLLAGAVNVVLNYLLIQYFGMIGAAIATVASMYIAAALVSLRLLLFARRSGV